MGSLGTKAVGAGMVPVTAALVAVAASDAKGEAVEVVLAVWLIQDHPARPGLP